MKISKWNKPGTNEVRVYFNGVAEDVKVFAVQNGNCFEIKFSRNMYNSQKDSIMDSIDMDLNEMNDGENVTTWEELLKLVK